jgi:hypothetical protein
MKMFIICILRHTIIVGLLPAHCRFRGLLLYLTTLFGLTRLGKTPLVVGSARRRGLYLHNTHKSQTSIYRMGFEPTTPASEWSHIYALNRAATGIGYVLCRWYN